ncbi:MAG: hypothetical protein KatS3mg102_0016 [Planctomycetota bacterium]|nr:MAG: hypothetical protein KatS3mg102_0016 [Planctomycetota bacterium]
MLRPRWRIEMLGGLRVAGAGRTIERFRTHKAAALLAWLALRMPAREPREVLIEMLWPQAPPRAGRASLSQALSSLRRQLEPPGSPRGSVIAADRAAVGLQPRAVLTDVAALHAALAAARAAPPGERRAALLAQAVALYRGELLPGHYEEWILRERAAVRAELLAACRELAALRLAAGDRPGALAVLRRAAGADPLAEEVRCELARLLALEGDRSAALRELRALQAALRAELDVAPAPRTRALAAALARADAAALPAAACLPQSEPPAPDASARRPDAPAQLPAAGPAPAADLAPAPPPPPSAPLTALPLLPGRLFGREAALARLARWLVREGVRLVTVTGPPGVGKTRLALEAAHRLEAARPGSVCYVPLAELRPPAAPAAALFEALGLEPGGGEPDPLAQIAAALGAGDRPAVLVLDNAEHLLPQVAALVQQLLARLPRLCCLVTSRAPLGLGPERLLPLEPLALPPVPEPSVAPPPPQALLGYASVALFVERAQAALPDFQLTPANAAAVAELVRRLEGIPLALELAAARVPVLAPRQILQRLERGLEVLQTRRRDVPARHRSLRAAIAWSIEQLPPGLRRTLAALAVFQGPFDLQAARRVTALPARRVEEALEQLCAHSLLVREPGRELPRFAALLPIREQLAGALGARERERLRRRHALHFLRLAERASQRLQGPQARVWLERLAAVRDNLRAALAWSLERAARRELGLRLAAALGGWWYLRGPFDEGRLWLERLLRGRGRARAAVRAAAHRWAGVLALEQGAGAEARAHLERCLQLRRRARDRAGLAEALLGLANASLRAARHAQARAELEQGLAAARAAGARWTEAALHNTLGLLAIAGGEHEQGRAHLQAALARARRGRYERLAATVLMNLGALAIDRGEPEAARPALERSLQTFRALGARGREAFVLRNLAALASARGEHARAGALSEQALAIFQRLGHRRGVMQLALCAADAALEQGALERAAARARQGLVRAAELDEPAALASALEFAARLVHARGDPRAAARLAGAAEALRARAGVPRVPVAQRPWRQCCRELRRALGARAYAAATGEGAALPPELAVRRALELLSSIPAAGPARPGRRAAGPAPDGRRSDFV